LEKASKGDFAMTTEQDVLGRKSKKKYLDAIFWGGAFLWAGLVFGLDSFGYLPQIGEASVWSWVFLGVGVYGLLLNLIRLFSSGFSNATAWDWVWAIIFTIIGAAGFVAISVPWWLFLILIGAVILGTALFRQD
jgi:hypothetical protein